MKTFLTVGLFSLGLALASTAQAADPQNACALAGGELTPTENGTSVCMAKPSETRDRSPETKTAPANHNTTRSNKVKSIVGDALDDDDDGTDAVMRKPDATQRLTISEEGVEEGKEAKKKKQR